MKTISVQDMLRDNGWPAFPNNNLHDTEKLGMTLRDYFAAKAMHAILCRPNSVDLNPVDVADEAYEFATYMVDKMQELRYK